MKTNLNKFVEFPFIFLFHLVKWTKHMVHYNKCAVKTYTLLRSDYTMKLCVSMFLRRCLNASYEF
jgi:hypothetical protein